MNALRKEQVEEHAADDPADPGLATDEERSVDQLIRENAQLRRMLSRLQGFRTLAYRDQLTELWNRRYFDERMAEELSRARRDSQRRFSLMIVDVNDLKRINDNEGHAAGDLAIKWAAGFLKRSLRDTDIICRTGGDEFTVIFPELGLEDCSKLVARLRRLLREAATRGEARLGLSIGTASYPDSATSLRGLVEGADSAMYSDKREQKRHTDPGMQSAR